MSGAEIEAMLQDIVARQQIHDALMRNARGVDRLDREMILSSYFPGAIDDHGAFNGPAEQFADWVVERHTGAIPSCTHFLGNSLVHVEGDIAYGETYNSVYYRFPSEEGDKDMVAFGRYLDRFERRDGEWRIAHRKIVFERDRIDLVTAQYDGPVTRDTVKGARDRTDRSYGILLTVEAKRLAGAEAVIEESLARRQIHEALMRLNRGADRADRSLILAAFHADAVADYGAFVGSPEGLATWVLEQQTADSPSSVHFLGNLLVQVAGDVAVSEAYFLRARRFTQDGELADLVEVGRYLDRFERRQGDWKIASRTVVQDLSRVDRVTGQWDGPLTQQTTKGVRSQEDFSYRYPI